MAVFGIGLATVLSVVGLLALWGRSVAVRRTSSTRAVHALARVAPIVSAAVITLVGIALSVLAITGLTGSAQRTGSVRHHHLFEGGVT